jgi:hypothetical protein
MQHLVDNNLPDESWDEYADHSLTHDDLPPLSLTQKNCEADNERE